jgi:peptidyl-prolyl cis-trans isomerase SurA
MDRIGFRKTIARTALALFLSLSPVARAGEVIDRIVATVNGHIILQSDWNDALRYEAVLSARPLGQFSDEDRRSVLDRLIDQELLAEQMKSASFQHASESDAAPQLAEARKLYPEAASEQGWQQILDRFGLTEKALIEHVQEQMDLMRLVDAHLRPAVQIDSKSIEAYYRDKFVPQLKQSGAGDVPLADVSAKIRELLTEEKVSELMVSWLQSLRSESKVSVPGIGDSPEEGVQTR